MAPADQHLGGDDRSGLDHGHRHLAVALVGHPEHRAVDDVGVGVQHVLDHAGVEVHAAADDQVAEPVGQEEVAVVVEASDVAHGEGVVEPGGGRLVGVVVVLEAPVGGAHVDQALLAGGHRREGVGVEDADLDAGPGPAHRARALEPLGGRDAGGPALAHAVQLPHLGLRQGLDEALLDPHRAGRAGVDDVAQARQVVAGPLGLGHLEQADEVGGGQERRGHPVGLDQAQQLAGVPRAHEHHRAPHVQGGVGVPGGAGVVEGSGGQVHVVGP